MAEQDHLAVALVEIGDVDATRPELLHQLCPLAVIPAKAGIQ